MKIARTIESFYPFMSGPANQAYMISSKLMGEKIQSLIFTTYYKVKASPPEETFKGIKVRRFRIKKSYMKYLYTPDMAEELINYNPDIIHAHNYRSFQTELGFKAAKKLKIPFVINTHGGLLGYQKITKGLNKAPYWLYDIAGGKGLIKDADAVIVSSRQEYEEAVKFGVNKEKLHIIPMGIDINDYQRIKRTRKQDKLVLLFVGRITRDRNVMPIIRAVEQLDDKKIELRVVGGAEKRSDTEKPGYLKELKAYVKNNNLNITFTGPRYDDELKKEYRNADIFVYTSLWENFGQTILEAGAAGLPIISTPVGVAEEIVKDNKTGYLVDFHDEEMISDRIRILLDKKKRETMKNRIQEIIKHQFAWEDIINRYAALYNKLKS